VSVKDWNLYDVADFRTNCAMEGTNRVFNSSLTTPTIWKFIAALKKLHGSLNYNLDYI
jgi:hypothetical protein